MPKYLEGHYEADTSSEASDIESEEHFKHRMHGKPEPKNVEGPAEYRKGFANMDKDFVRKVGRKGGKHSHGSRGKLSEEEYQQELEEFSDEAGFGEGEEIEAYGGTGKQGFASMPKSKVRRIARKGGKIGGKHSHGFGPQYYDEEFLYPHPGYKGMDAPEHRRRKRSHKHEDTSSRKRSKTEEQSDLSEEEEEDTSHKGKQGFASMPKEKVRAIAAKGGRHSHGGKGKHYDEDEDDMSEEDTHTHRKSSGHGKQGFASMPKEKVRAIAAKGGRHSHGGKGKHYDEDEDESEGESRSQRKSSSSGHHKQGFAAMPKEKLRAIASKGGRHSHGIYDEDDDDESEGEHTTQSRRRSSGHHGKQGFASMPKEKVRAIAAKGGRHSHGGKGKHYDDDDDDMSEEDTHSRRKSSGSSHHGKQGFASMPKEQVRAIAAKGGRNSHKYSH